MTVYKHIKLDKEFISFIEDVAQDEVGNCQVCEKKLSEGDYRDGLAPYHIENNICKKCKLEKE